MHAFTAVVRRIRTPAHPDPPTRITQELFQKQTEKGNAAAATHRPPPFERSRPSGPCPSWPATLPQKSFIRVRRFAPFLKCRPVETAHIIGNFDVSDAKNGQVSEPTR
jgi:hypothetical protein